ncbi:MAG: DUF6364 family protein [Bryobacteraceae bacterium]
MSKLTLSVDEAVALQAKKYAKNHGVSISGLVENYLKGVSEPTAENSAAPVLRMLRGNLKPSNSEEYRRYLVEKYRCN